MVRGFEGGWGGAGAGGDERLWNLGAPLSMVAITMHLIGSPPSVNDIVPVMPSNSRIAAMPSRTHSRSAARSPVSSPQFSIACSTSCIASHVSAPTSLGVSPSRASNLSMNSFVAPVAPAAT